MRVRLVAVLLLAGACGGPGARQEAVVYTSVDQVFSDPVFRACEERLGIAVSAVFDTEETKSTGILNRLIAEAGHPQADVFWSGDPVRPFLLVSRGLVEPYASPEASAVPAVFRAADGTWTGIAARARGTASAVPEPQPHGRRLRCGWAGRPAVTRVAAGAGPLGGRHTENSRSCSRLSAAIAWWDLASLRHASMGVCPPRTEQRPIVQRTPM